jgi:hypothetical protein
MKICIRCTEPKPLDAFGNYSRYADGKHRYCRDCWNAIQTEYKRAHGVTARLPLLERLWSGVQQCGHEEWCIFCCWPWLRGCDSDGYGKTSINNQNTHLHVRVTHVIYEITHAQQLPMAMIVCHYCDNPPCCNPWHLWAGTLNDNRQDCVRKGRQAKGLMAGVYTMPEAFPRGAQKPTAKLTEHKVHDIRERYAQGNITAQQLGSLYHVSKFAILSIIHRRTWNHI